MLQYVCRFGECTMAHVSALACFTAIPTYVSAHGDDEDEVFVVLCHAYKYAHSTTS